MANSGYKTKRIDGQVIRSADPCPKCESLDYVVVNNTRTWNERHLCLDCGYLSPITKTGAQVLEEARERGRRRRAQEEAGSDGPHHPDCQCNVCFYGADAAKWLFNPSEY